MASKLENLNISLALMQFFTQWQLKQREIDAKLSHLRRRRRSVAGQLKTLMEKMYPSVPMEQYQTLIPLANIPPVQDLTKPKRKYKRRAKKKEDDVNGKRPRVWSLSNNNLWFETQVPNFSEGEFLEQFHVSRKTYLFLCEQLRDDLTKSNTNMRKAIRVEKRVAVGLYMLSKPQVCTYRHIAELFSMGKSTIGGALYDFSKAVCKTLLPKFISFPSGDAVAETVQGFESTAGFPDCIGTIDFTHIPLFTPLGSNLPTEYLNDNGWYSMILMCVTDHRNRFTYVNSGYPGKLDNLSIFTGSSLHQLATEGKIVPPDQNYHLAAGKDMPLRRWIMTPYVEENLTDNQRLFNERLCTVRSSSQATIDRMKGRWGFLLNKCNKKLDRVANIFLTCCVLHNLCEENGDSYLSSWEQEVAIASRVGPHQPVPTYFTGQSNNDAINKRDEIAQLLMLPTLNST